MTEINKNVWKAFQNNFFFHFLGICFACDNISVFLDRLDLVSRSLDRSRRDQKRRAAGLQRSRPGNTLHSCHNVQFFHKWNCWSYYLKKPKWCTPLRFCSKSMTPWIFNRVRLWLLHCFTWLNNFKIYFSSQISIACLYLEPFL